MNWRLHIITRLEQRVSQNHIQNPQAPWSADARHAGETLAKGVEVDFKLGFCSGLRNHILRLNKKHGAEWPDIINIPTSLYMH